VATAPLAAAGHINCSPKGGALRVLDGTTLAYCDGLGSGIETIAHLRENARLVIMLCAFKGPPRIMRFHGRGEVLETDDAEFAALLPRFPVAPTVRAIVRLKVTRIADSCGYGVPRYDYLAERDEMRNYVRKSSDAALRQYVSDRNGASLDGLPGLRAEAAAGLVINR
jgi:hypothetical protein